MVSPYLTPRAAATYCGFKTVCGLHSAYRAGKVQPAGRRGGGRGPLMWRREDLDAYLIGASNGRVDETLGLLDRADTDPTGDLSPPERRVPRSMPGAGAKGGATNRHQGPAFCGAAPRGRGV